MTATTRINRVCSNVRKLNAKHDNLPSFFGGDIDEGFLYSCLDGFCDDANIEIEVAQQALWARKPGDGIYAAPLPSDLLADIYEYAYSCYREYVEELTA